VIILLQFALLRKSGSPKPSADEEDAELVSKTEDVNSKQSSKDSKASNAKDTAHRMCVGLFNLSACIYRGFFGMFRWCLEKGGISSRKTQQNGKYQTVATSPSTKKGGELGNVTELGDPNMDLDNEIELSAMEITVDSHSNMLGDNSRHNSWKSSRHAGSVSPGAMTIGSLHGSRHSSHVFPGASHDFPGASLETESIATGSPSKCEREMLVDPGHDGDHDDNSHRNHSVSHVGTSIGARMWGQPDQNPYVEGSENPYDRPIDSKGTNSKGSVHSNGHSKHSNGSLSYSENPEVAGRDHSHNTGKVSKGNNDGDIGGKRQLDDDNIPREYLSDLGGEEGIASGNTPIMGAVRTGLATYPASPPMMSNNHGANLNPNDPAGHGRIRGSYAEAPIQYHHHYATEVYGADPASGVPDPTAGLPEGAPSERVPIVRRPSME
jgi:hypothetical protein